MINHKIKYGIKVAYALFFTAALIILAWFSLMYKHKPALSESAITDISNVMIQIENNEPYDISLPAKINELLPHTKVTLFAEFDANMGDSLQIKSVFAPVRVFIDDELTYEGGQSGSYPSYMNDPPTIITNIPLSNYGRTTKLKIEYMSPTQRNELSLPVIFTGNETSLLENQFRTNGFSFFFAVILIFLGFTMMLVSITIVRRVPAGTSFLWLGLFSLSAGVWVLGESDLSAFIIPYPVLLYNMAYLGLFSVTIPFLHFGLILLNPVTKTPFKIMLIIHYTALASSVALHFSGIMDFIRSLYWFHVIAPLGFVVFTACLIFEHFRYHTRMMKQFALASSIMAISVILELINYWLGLTGSLTVFFQLGVLVFIISLSIISGHYVRKSVLTAAEKSRLEFEMSALSRQLELQRTQYLKMAEDDAAIKEQRHDLRHQFTVLMELNKQRNNAKLDDYLHTLIKKIPADKEIRLCENYAVNAVSSYYATLASNEDIHMNLQFAVPGILEPSVESDLCIIVGNVLENAIEACRRMKGNNKFIRLQSRMEYETLVMTVENSFEGTIHKKDGIILSSKRDGEGIGLSSVETVAKRYGGSVRFEARDGVFSSLIYLQLENV
ncbi:GHKL domain-containing protein [Sedimentibacter hydroxybenzoicus DSM 7310]|uniref:GHKL domain-containing protein n=1 Tax=Sedimentibacter hydroxybenzoicus DSM 7310 TaxID=1123245 RepID=A0A974BIB7_SEDHY|nr:GHKL domain-containing protein [Sedimentibacter hydroxybenzoicus]NYB73647.1 GHKL domain-containing protein [Sedimentibacter hydroxybenzoicus DSM 7310]